MCIDSDSVEVEVRRKDAAENRVRFRGESAREDLGNDTHFDVYGVDFVFMGCARRNADKCTSPAGIWAGKMNVPFELANFAERQFGTWRRW